MVYTATKYRIYTPIEQVVFRYVIANERATFEC